MRAILLAAGKSSRTWPLTEKLPKPLLRVLDKTVIEHNLCSLAALVEEVVIVVGFMKERIMEALGNEFQGTRLRYVVQDEQLGTGDAVLKCKGLFKDEKFLILGGDDVFSRSDMERLASLDNATLACITKEPENYGIYTVDSKNNMIDIAEKPKDNVGNLANTGCYVISGRIFKYLEMAKKSQRGEIEFTDALKDYMKTECVSFKVELVKDYWLPITYPWHYLEANVFLLHRLKGSDIKGHVEDNVTIKGNVVVGEGTMIKSGTYIEGPAYIGKNCLIGPMAYIRPDTVIMDNVNLRAEVFDSVLMSGVVAKHNCYIGHSVIGENANIAAGTITSDYRHDGSEHTTVIKGNKIRTGRRKLGAFLGDSVMTGVGTLIYPGRKIGAGITTLPGEIVMKDKE